MRHYHSERHFLTPLGFGLSLVEAVSLPLPLPSAHYAEWTRHSLNWDCTVVDKSHFERARITQSSYIAKIESFF